MPLEWLIDLIKEWVIAQAYATEAWVLEWVTPLHISGTLDPDSTCTYHKAGTYNDRPYYIRSDGEYHLWWNGTHLWLISEDLGVAAQPLWGRNNPEILGNYAPVAPTVGIATVSSGYGCPHLHYVPILDANFCAHGIGDFITDNAFHELDYSPCIPAGVICINLSLGMRADVVEAATFWKSTDQTWFPGKVIMYTQAANILKRKIWPQAIGADRKILYKFDNVNWTSITSNVRGYWL